MSSRRRTNRTGCRRRSNTTVTDIAALAQWINAYYAARGRADTIPEDRGRLLHLTTRQFRRTLAWFIAHRPGGTIASALQYRHQRIQMFEGYAGTSTPASATKSREVAACTPTSALRRSHGLCDLEKDARASGYDVGEAVRRSSTRAVSARCGARRDEFQKALELYAAHMRRVRRRIAVARLPENLD
ncbi:hypothetical protein [Streptomyces sp. NPDC059862]|uniref:hypothetical protein n=1 Tax=unclassified Streptomyces TaxID=2593676 RepID=UPI0036458847